MVPWSSPQQQSDPWGLYSRLTGTTPMQTGFYLYQQPSIQIPFYPQSYSNIPAYERPVNYERMRKVFDWRTNKANGIPVPPVLLEHCTSEPYPKPLVVRLATTEWRARRRAARRRHLPLRSRPGARPCPDG